MGIEEITELANNGNNKEMQLVEWSNDLNQRKLNRYSGVD